MWEDSNFNSNMKVVNRNGDLVKYINSKNYVFINNITSTSIKVDKNIYPYVKIDGVYYQNDGETFTVTDFNKSALIMRSSSLYTIDSKDGVSFYQGDKTGVNNKNTSNTIQYIEKNTSVNSLNPVAYARNFNIQNNAVAGRYPRKQKSANERPSFRYILDNKTIQEEDKLASLNEQKNPLYWDFVLNQPFVCYSSFDDGFQSDWKSKYVQTVNEGYSEQIYEFTGIGGRDNVSKYDIEKEWWNESETFGFIYSGEQDQNDDGRWDNSIQKYLWYEQTIYPGQDKQIYTTEKDENTLSLKKNIDSLIITLNNKVTRKYFLESNQRVVIAKQDLFDLQEEVDRQNARRFMMIYSTSMTSSSVHVISTNAIPGDDYTSDSTSAILAPNLYFYGKEYSDAPVAGGVCKNDNLILLTPTDSLISFLKKDGNSPSYWSDLEMETNEKINLDINLPPLHYYDITDLLDAEQELLFPRDLSKLTSNLIVDNLVEDGDENPRVSRIYSTNHSFSFPSKKENDFSNNLHVYWPKVTYKLNIKNMISFKGVSPTIEMTSKSFLNVKQANLECISTRVNNAFLSSSINIQNFYSWRIPRCFKNSFVSFTHDRMGISDHSSGTSALNTIFYIRDYRKGFDIWTRNDGSHADFICFKDVAGWDYWFQQGLQHLIPASTSRSAENNIDTMTTWASSVKYTSPNMYTTNYIGDKGMQLGLTMGLLINKVMDAEPSVEDINAIDWETKGHLDYEMPNIAVIICNNQAK